MNEPLLSTTAHLDAARREGDRVASLPIDSLDAPVPGLADWNVERVVRHLGKIHHWVANLVAAGPEADLGEVAAASASMPKGPACLPAYQDAHEGMLAALEACDPDQPAKTLVGEDTVAFWCRRMAHEVAIHRIDADDAVHAAGGPDPRLLDSSTARDGVDEWMHVFVGGRSGGDDASGQLRGAELALEATVGDDRPAWWRATFDDAASISSVARLDVGETAAPGTAPDATLSGPADALLLVCWRRRPIDTVEVSGDPSAAHTFLERMRF